MATPITQFKSTENLEYIAYEVKMSLSDVRAKIPSFLAEDTRYSDDYYLEELTTKKNSFWKIVRELNIGFIHYLRNLPEVDEYENYSMQDLLAGNEFARKFNKSIGTSVRMPVDPSTRLERIEKIPPWQIITKKSGLDQKPINSGMQGLDGRRIGKSIYK
jgi:hypothetical protein